MTNAWVAPADQHSRRGSGNWTGLHAAVSRHQGQTLHAASCNRRAPLLLSGPLCVSSHAVLSSPSLRP